jgi:hypothetical protein
MVILARIGLTVLCGLGAVGCGLLGGGSGLGGSAFDYTGAYMKTNPKNASEPAGAAIDFSENNIIMCDWEEGFGILPGDYFPDSSTIELDDYDTVYDVIPEGDGFTLKVGNTGTGVYIPMTNWEEATAEATLDCGSGFGQGDRGSGGGGNGEGGGDDGDNSCEFANDGECDEPLLCAIGTDSSDC